MYSYDVSLTRVEKGFVTVKANNATEAKRKALLEEEKGNAVWNTSNVEVGEVQVVSLK